MERHGSTAVMKRALRRVLVALRVYPYVVLWLLPFKKMEWDVLVARARLTGRHDVLDVGCGGGFLTVLLARRAARAVGVDIRESSIAIARQDAVGQPNALFKAASIQTAGFNDSSFDRVFSFSVLE